MSDELRNLEETAVYFADIRDSGFSLADISKRRMATLSYAYSALRTLTSAQEEMVMNNPSVCKLYSHKLRLTKNLIKFYIRDDPANSRIPIKNIADVFAEVCSAAEFLNHDRLEKYKVEARPNEMHKLQGAAEYFASIPKDSTMKFSEIPQEHIATAIYAYLVLRYPSSHQRDMIRAHGEFAEYERRLRVAKQCLELYSNQDAVTTQVPAIGLAKTLADVCSIAQKLNHDRIELDTHTIRYTNKRF